MPNANAAVLAAGDKVPPTGTVLVNYGAARAKKATAKLTLSASDPSPASGVESMRFSNDGINWSAWEPYATSKTWKLSKGKGTRTVYVEFRDGVGNVSEIAKDTIVLKK
jgi:hypothetical protein